MELVDFGDVEDLLEFPGLDEQASTIICFEHRGCKVCIAA